MKMSEKQLQEYVNERISYWFERMNAEQKQYQYAHFMVYVTIKDVIFGATEKEIEQYNSIRAMMQVKVGFEK